MCAAPGALAAVYVDSGSTDESVKLARSFGAETVELDLSRPFTAARARNHGFARLREIAPELRYVQFVDGDCALADGWLEAAADHLNEHPDVAVVCGHLMERNRSATIYNRLCHMEWQKAPGEISACGGIFMVRGSCFAEVGGFDSTVTAAEDDELCLRIRRARGKVIFLDRAMASHDAAMTHFGQWWKRARRAGHAYAQGTALHGNSPDRHFVRDCQRIWFWGLILPLLASVPAWWTHGLSLMLLCGYLVLATRIYRNGLRRGWSRPDARLYAVFTVIAKFPGLLGMLQFHCNRWRGRRPMLIEYKGVEKPA